MTGVTEHGRPPGQRLRTNGYALPGTRGWSRDLLAHSCTRKGLGTLLVHTIARNPRHPRSEEHEDSRYIDIDNESLTLIVFNLNNQSTPGYLQHLIFLDSLLCTTLSSASSIPRFTHSPRTNRRTQAHGTCTSLRSFTVG
jgi:hypothetical protein